MLACASNVPIEISFSDLGSEPDPQDSSDALSNSSVSELERQEDLGRLMFEVEKLPQEYREVLMLFYYQELKYRDIAGLLDVSTATVNARLTKARAMLRERLCGSQR